MSTAWQRWHLNKWKGSGFRETRQSNRQRAAGDPYCIILIPVDREEDRFVSLPDQWPTLPWHFLTHLSSPLWFHCWNRKEDFSSRTLELSSSSSHPSLLDAPLFVLFLFSWCKMSWYCSLAVKALLVNPIVSFGFVRDLDYYIDHAGLLHTQHAN